ncbi:TIGR03936 family radical SAM-associated protein [Clostridium sp. SYSU_GA19001]|uniref:TIGR03936 family radical SAM-associated protein n=1 Tax=Clostridium caldaquaticum TaxID=2940653 RepID=UPI0020774136|nr:TIGR03936 family radical SAM-associated protein [Clostridium caldaquaticum]MCM8710377.1 TIGR03936 family radical SAM-associated protein [Clostridium caldaquaticum]
MKVRYLIKFSKESHIKFISHLDLLRTLQRVVRRAALPIEYSKGFNPHMTVSIAQPLSVGMYSVGEYVDMELTEYVKENYIKDVLNNNAPSGIKFLQVTLVKENNEGKKIPQAMALIDAAKYIITIKYKNTDVLKEELENLLSHENWEILKKSKSGEKLVDIRKKVKSFDFIIENNCLRIDCILSCGSKENLSAELLAQFIKNNTTAVNSVAFVDVMREELYVEKGNKFIPLCDFVK